MQIQTKITLDHWGNFGKRRPIIYVRFVIKTRGEPIAFSKVIWFEIKSSYVRSRSRSVLVLYLAPNQPTSIDILDGSSIP